ncbi:MAG: diadenylate cyclase [Myxococcota bacterium]
MDALFAGVRLVDVLDIALVAFFFWILIAWVREARARVALGGVLAVACLYLASTWLDLRLMTDLLQGFIAVAALILVVLFQDDLRRFFEGITLWLVRNATPRPPSDVLDELGALCFSFARHHVGALFVLPGREPLARLLDGGQYLDGRVSEPLLRSLLDPSTPGHDGAIVVRGTQVTRFGVHLPLSTEWAEIGAGGTRHAAGLGLAERSDAFSIIVSEERGEVSVACRGRLERMENEAELRERVDQFLSRTARRRREPWMQSRLTLARQNWREGLLAVAVACGLWIHSIPGGEVDRGSKIVPIAVTNLPEGYRVESIEPPSIDVEFEGRRRDLALAPTEEFEVRVDADLVDQGRRTFSVEEGQVAHPESLRIVGLEPIKIRLNIETTSASGS